MTMVSYTCSIAMIALVLGVGLAFLRLIKGPTLHDRVVALDLIATLLVGLTTISSIQTGNEVFLYVAMVVALFSFIGTMGFCWYLQQEQQP
ncbi:Na(+)/H(+) antiporter subunit F [Novipirellula aureliae]|uniref:Na(+)/H(+) antiporter subunit F n=1 Tax=Novipirellula aureliae TaxID=2527966 RepID=A0A5C6E8W5_9BACT|nr:monovalent cation/H+ antiporter complex subunit F [Novipirellula aureliae]TWU45024.1 Na(+)/H(+) antiporter subunit F [Novipirellula aureliae]